MKKEIYNSKKNDNKHMNLIIDRIIKQIEPNEDQYSIDMSKEQIIKNKINDSNKINGKDKDM